MAKKKEVDVLVNLQTILEGTTIFDIPPHFERWEDGLESLDRARKELTKIKAALEHTPGASRALVVDVARIHGLLGDFVKLRDHFRNEHPKGGSSHDWTQRQVAERQLEELQRRAADLRSRLRTGEYSSGGDVAPTMEWRWFSVGIAMLLAAIVFAAWGFSLKGLVFHQRRILLWLLPLASGFAAGAFAGSFSAKARNWVPGLIISATGGFGVWFLSFFLLFPDDGKGLSESNDPNGDSNMVSEVLPPSAEEQAPIVSSKYRLLTGRVVDSKSGIGIRGAKVSIIDPALDLDQKTDSVGQFSLRVPAEVQPVRVLVERIGYEDVDQWVGSDGVQAILLSLPKIVKEATAESLTTKSEAQPQEPRFPLYVTPEMVRTCSTRGGNDKCALPGIEVTMGGQKYTRGVVYTQSYPDPGLATINIPRGAKSFGFIVGNYWNGGDCGGQAPMIMSVLVDGKEVWKANVSSTHNEVVPLPSGSRVLVLKGESGDGDARCDDSIWVNARFE